MGRAKTQNYEWCSMCNEKDEYNEQAINIMNTALTHLPFVYFLLEFCNSFVFESNADWKARIVEGRRRVNMWPLSG